MVVARSPTDRLAGLQDKMQEYIENGVKLGWLINRQQKNDYIYRPNVAIECLESPVIVRGEPVLPGFVLDLSKIW